MSDTNHTATPVEMPVEAANEVVTAEVKVAQNHADTISPDARKLAEEMYKLFSSLLTQHPFCSLQINE